MTKRSWIVAVVAVLTLVVGIYAVQNYRMENQKLEDAQREGDRQHKQQMERYRQETRDIIDKVREK